MAFTEVDTVEMTVAQVTGEPTPPTPAPDTFTQMMAMMVMVMMMGVVMGQMEGI